MRTDKLTARAEDLVARGDQLLSDRFEFGYPDIPGFYEWQAAIRSFLYITFGESHPHYSMLNEKMHTFDDMVIGIGIVRAAYEDLKEGFIEKIHKLVAAEVFSDFIEMAKHLLETGYKDAAATTLGAVLEDGLRRIASKHGAKVRERDDLSSLNSRLADQQVYNRLTQKQVQVWADIRNAAAHGKYDQYRAEDVMDMARGVERFLEENL